MRLESIALVSRGAPCRHHASQASDSPPVKSPPCAREARALGGADRAQAQRAEHGPGVGIVIAKCSGLPHEKEREDDVALAAKDNGSATRREAGASHLV